MKINMPVTQREVPYPKGMYVVSQTDLKGVIRDANEAFVALSGFTREELIGKSHNIVRHPDVPPAIFADMWASIKAGLPWQAVVKNRCKNGDHYWVDAQVVPIIKNGEISGYMSVRREASRQQISEAEALFAEVKRTGKFNSIRRKPTPLSVWLYGIASFSIVMFILNNALMFMGTPLWLEKTVGILGMLALLPLPFVLHAKVFAPLNEVRKNILRLTEGDLASRYPILKPNEIGQIANSFQIMQTQWLVSLDHIKDSIRDSLQGMQHVNEESDSINRQIESQHDRVSAVAAATEEFCQAIAEVASHAADTSRAAETSEGLIQTSQQTVKAGMQAAEVVVGAVSKSHTSIAELDQAVGKIGDITKVIKEIAEQTNLLALNAAIEAARAGETGRGFAVVADEVRKLAERTARSTQEINGMVSGIQNMASEVVASMDEAASAVESSSGKMRESVEGLNRVTEASRNTLEMAEHIATASDQQSIAGQEVANNMEQISQLSEQNQDKLRSLKQSLEEMRVATNRIDEAVGVFKLFSR